MSDSVQRGLKLRLTDKGAATWSLQLTVQGRKRRFTIGGYPDIGLSEARKRAARLRIEALDGRDPVHERRRVQVPLTSPLTVEAALNDYNALHLQPQLRTGSERLRQLQRSLSQHLTMPLSELSRVHLQQVLDEKAMTAPVAANRIRAGLSAFVGWCWRRGYVESNFALATSKSTRETPRERVLLTSELGAIWSATNKMGELWQPYLQLLMLTAQRRGDLAQMEWSEIDFSVCRWSVPGAKTKNGRPHIVHLSEAAIAVLRHLETKRHPEISLVFTTTGSSPVSGFGRMKQRLDAFSGVNDWRLHDMRTTFATHMADHGIDESIVDRVLNHVASASSASTVARVYNRAERLTDRARALDRWALFVTEAKPESPMENYFDRPTRPKVGE